MHFLKKYNEKLVKYDFINKFNYKLVKNIPELVSVTLSFNLKKFSIKPLISSLASLKIITLNKGTITKSKVSNISLKIRKGQPVGCKLTLNNNLMYRFLFKILNKHVINLKIKKNMFNKIFSIKIRNILMFKDLENNYQFFKTIPDLNITIKTKTCNINEFIFLLNSFKIYRN